MGTILLLHDVESPIQKMKLLFAKIVNTDTFAPTAGPIQRIHQISIPILQNAPTTPTKPNGKVKTATCLLQL
jgi:hypothetical protein